MSNIKVSYKRTRIVVPLFPCVCVVWHETPQSTSFLLYSTELKKRCVSLLQNYDKFK